MDVTYIPDAMKAGASVIANCRAEMIEVKGKTKRVSGRVLDPEAQRPKTDFAIEAPVVIISASAIYSPVLLLRSRLANSSGEVGKHLTFHLTTAVVAIFDRIIYAAGGIPQSYICDEFLNKQGDGGGFWIEAVPVYPALASLALPGFGDEHRRIMRLFPYLGALIVLVKEIDSEGSVSLNSHGRPTIKYKLRGRDLSYLKQGLAIASEILFAAGAREVLTLHNRPMRSKTVGEMRKNLASAGWGPNELALFSAHPLGTCRMGEDPRSSVVNSYCETHDVKGLFVIDGSVTPTSLGVNPQVTILALATKCAEWIAENFSHYKR